MGKRSITDDEIALIKAMLARRMKNSDIQFFFNRPDRRVNSGRITGIANGSYSDSASIAAADDKTLDASLASWNLPSGKAFAVTVPGPASSQPCSPLTPTVIAGLFACDNGGVWRFKSGESDEHECKSSFGFKHSSAWLRAIAALANNRGGYVIFGVHDKDGANTGGKDQSYAVTGLQTSDFASADPADFAKRIRSALDPTPRVQIAHADIGGKIVGIIHVEQHPSRPVIATKQEGDIRKATSSFAIRASPPESNTAIFAPFSIRVTLSPASRCFPWWRSCSSSAQVGPWSQTWKRALSTTANDLSRSTSN